MNPGRKPMLEMNSSDGGEKVGVYAYDYTVEIRVESFDGGAKISLVPSEVDRLRAALNVARVAVLGKMLSRENLSLLAKPDMRKLRDMLDEALSDDDFD